MKKTHCKCKGYLLNMQEFVVSFCCKSVTFCLKVTLIHSVIISICSVIISIHSVMWILILEIMKYIVCMKSAGYGIQDVE